MKTDVVIIGAGPSGLMLAHLLHAAGVNPIVLERHTQEHVLSRIRAGVLESTTTDVLVELGIDERMNRESLQHDGVVFADGERLIRIDMAALTGRHVTVYGQTEVTKDLIDAAEDRNIHVVWESEDVALHNVDGVDPHITYTKNGKEERVDAKLIAGCDGFHGPSRQVISAETGRPFELIYPFGWLGVLADVPPCTEELIYANHERGFALASMRSMSRSRYYIQVPLDQTIDDWPDEKFWDEICTRLGPNAASHVTRGPSLEKSIAPLRSFVFEPMNHGRLFLAGDAAHIVPPTGAKGLNLAASDIVYLSDAMIAYFKSGDEAALKGYSAKALARIWKSERFSWYLTKLMHRFPENADFDRRMQLAELDYLAESEAMQTMLAENYVGLPI